MIISKKKFEEEINKRVEEQIKKFEEMRWREDRERDNWRKYRELEHRLIAVEKKCKIDHPSHRDAENVPVYC